MGRLTKTVFLDRDGVINRLILERGPRETPITADDFELLPTAKEALALLKSHGFTLVVVTNQPNVAKGKSTWADFKEIDEKMQRELGKAARIDAIYACTHHPDPSQVVVSELLKKCECRKPEPGLLLQAQKDLAIDMSKAWLVGDASTDIKAGLNAGLKPDHLLFIGDQYDESIPAFKNVLGASRFVLARSLKSK